MSNFEFNVNDEMDNLLSLTNVSSKFSAISNEWNNFPQKFHELFHSEWLQSDCKIGLFIDRIDQSILNWFRCTSTTTVNTSSEHAHRFRLLGNEQFKNKNYRLALIYYNLAIACAVDQASKFSHSENDCESELSLAYSNRALVFASLNQWSDVHLDLDRAIRYSVNSKQKKKLYLRKLSYLTGEFSTVEHWSQADVLLEMVKRQCSLTELEYKFLDQINTQLEQRKQLKQLNTINLNSKQANMKKLLNSIRLPLLIKQDKPLINRWIDSESCFEVDHDQLEMTVPNESSTPSLSVKKGKTVEQCKLLMLEQPLAFIQNCHFNLDHCANCLNSLDQVSVVPCRQCSHLVFYCDEQCESDGWNTFHNLECGEQSSKLWNQLEPVAKILTRIIAKFESNIDSVVDFMANVASGKQECQWKTEFYAGNISHRRWFEIVCQCALEDLLKRKETDQKPNECCLDPIHLAKLSIQAVIIYRLFLAGKTRIHNTPNNEKDVQHKTNFVAQQQHLQFPIIQSIVQMLILLESKFTQLALPIQVDDSLCFRLDLFQNLLSLEQFSSTVEFSSENISSAVTVDSGEKQFHLWNIHLMDQFTNNDLVRMQINPKTIAIGLFVTNLFLNFDNDDCSKSNVTTVFNGQCRALRCREKLIDGGTKLVAEKFTSIETWLANGEYNRRKSADMLSEMDIELLTIQAQWWPHRLIDASANGGRMNSSCTVLNNNDYLTTKINYLEQLLQNEIAKPVQHYWLQLGLCHDLRRYHSKCGNYAKAVHYADQMIDLLGNSIFSKMDTKFVEKLSNWILLQQCRDQFELFTERDVKMEQSISVATKCLLNSSNVIQRLYQKTVPLVICDALVNSDRERQQPNYHHHRGHHYYRPMDEQSLIEHDHLSVLIELEDMMVASDMFTKQFGNNTPTPPS